MKFFTKKIDWYLVAALAPLMLLSVSTLGSFAGEIDFMAKQLIWFSLSFAVFLFVSHLDLSFLKKSKFALISYGSGILLLLAIMVFGTTINGARSWFSFGPVSFQPTDLIKLILVIVLAKYLARRHVAIRSMKHVLITAAYFIIPFVMIFLQPDFGSAIIFFFIWLGMILVSGLSKKHIITLGVIGGAIIAGMWGFVFEDYQKNRIRTFIDPLSDIQGTGYNAYQSTIAVGSGQLLGKGVGYGTQSRLNFLPEYETDFIFAAISEEWGFVGSFMILALFGFISFRIVRIGYRSDGNFELFFALGLAFYYMSHVLVNIGMNIGLMPVTGVTLPFVSYGGSHLIVEFLGLGILMTMNTNKIRSHSNTSNMFLR